MCVRVLLMLLLVASTCTAYAQIRAFDGSKSAMPWVYNPTADLPEDVQAYFGYDARGNSSLTPQSILAGARMPIFGVRADNVRKGAIGVVGVQALNTSQSFMNALTVQVNYAHQLALTDKLKLGFGMGIGMYNLSYDQEDLVYMDAQDPMLNQGDRLFNLHLNAGMSLVADDRMFVQVAAPDLLKNSRGNLQEIMLRGGYIVAVNHKLNIIPSLHLDTYNSNMIYGGELRAEWREMVSVLAGADRYKFQGGLLLKLKGVSVGYSYGQNFSKLLNYIESHQISLVLGMPKGGKRRGL